MRRAGALFGCAALIVATTGARASLACHLTPDDKAANAKLSFEEFDQKGVTPSTWRALEIAGCHELAVEAASDYLANGPAQTPSHKSDVLFHEAQSLGMAGRDAEAARMVAAAIPPDRGNHGELDWTTYLIGTWAFLTGDKKLLESATSKMASEPGDGNRLDGAVLRGLNACFGKSYAYAYNVCWPRAKRK